MRLILLRIGIALLALLVIGVTAFVIMMKASGIPLAAVRPSAPSGIEGRALAVGATVAPFELPAASGGTFSLGSALRGGRVVLVFYRGAW